MFLKRITRIIAITYALLLSPILASEEEAIEKQYHMRLRNGQEKIEALQKEISLSLQAKEDKVILVKKQISEKRLRLETPRPFCEELEKLLELLRVPQELFSEEQRLKLIASPCLENLQPLTQIIDTLNNFIKKWSPLAAYAETLQLMANQTVWFQREGKEFVAQIKGESNEIDNQQILEKIYQWVEYFYSVPCRLSKACTEVKSHLREGKDFIPKTLKYLEEVSKELISFFQKRGEILWKIMRNHIETQNLSENLRDIPETYEKLPYDFFLKPNAIRSLFLDNNHPKKGKEKENSRLSIDRLERLIGVKLVETCALPDQWQEKITDIKEKTMLLVNMKFIIDDLKNLVGYYKNFQNFCTRNLNELRDTFTPWAHLVMPGQQLSLSQHMASKICCMYSNGPFCFEIDQEWGRSDDKLKPISDTTIGKVTFSKKTINPMRVGEQVARYWLGTLFNIPSAPMVFIAVDNACFWEPPLEFKESAQSLYNRSGGKDKFMESFLRNSAKWKRQSKVDFCIGQDQFTGSLLSDWLKKIALCQGSFDQLDRYSVGMQILFSFLTQSSVSDSHLMLVENENKYSLQRIALNQSGLNSFLHPSFEGAEADNKHALTERNILYLLPFANEEIPKEVKKDFASNDILLILSHWLTELNSLQEVYFDNLIKTYGLSKLPQTLEGMTEEEKAEAQKEMTKAQAWGLNISARPETINQLINNFNIIRHKISKSKITYLEVFKALRPHVLQCYELLMEKAQKETEKAELKIFFEKVVPSLIEQLRQLCSLRKLSGEKPSYTDKELSVFEECAKECLKTIQKLEGNERISFKKLTKGINDIVVKSFFQKKFTWAKESRIFEVDTIERVRNLLYDGENPIIYEDLIEKDLQISPEKWAKIPTFDGQESQLIAEILESTYSVKEMVRELASVADISSKPLNTAIEILTLLSQLLPHPNAVHRESCQEILERAKAEFSEIPRPVQVFFRELVIQKNEEKEDLQKAHFSQFKSGASLANSLFSEYDQLRSAENLGDSVTAWESQALPHSEQVAGYFLRKFWAGSLGFISDEDQMFFEAILDLFLLPKFSFKEVSSEIFKDPGSLGFASNPLGKEGPVKLRFMDGNHDVLPLSEKWIGLFRSRQTLSLQMRQTMLGHALPLLHLWWLSALKRSADNIRFHPWFIETLIEKSTALQDLLSTGLFFTFPEIMLNLWPEIYYAYQQKFKSHNNGTGQVLENLSQEANKPIPVEQKGVDLNWVAHPRNNKNLLSILHEWDDRRMQYATASFLSLEDAATAFFAKFNPHEYGVGISSLVLELASRFSIDVKCVKHDYWKDLKILQGLIRQGASEQVLQLGIALYMGCTIEGVEVNEEDNALKVSGTTGDIRALCGVISLFPSLVKLDLSNNHIGSVVPLVTYLQRLNLRELILEGNPIHNPVPLHVLPELEVVNISNTWIPSLSISDLQSLVPSPKKTPKKGAPPAFEKLQRIIVEGPEIIGGDHAVLIAQLVSYLKKQDQTPHRIVSIVERIAENFWKETLALNHKTLASENKINDLFDLLEAHDPRASAFKLAFALKFKLPPDAVPEKFCFHQDKITKEANCLSELNISDASVKSVFISSLSRFDHLTHLSLINTGLTKLDDLPRIPTLQLLNLRNNIITCLSGLRLGIMYDGNIKFPSLQVLNLANNQLKTDKWLDLILELNLMYLNMSGNRLSKVPKLKNYKKLENIPNTLKFLDLRGNEIGNLGDHQNSNDFFYSPQRSKK